MKKIKYLWFINLVMFASIVFLGIEQAGRGAEISNLEDKIENAISTKRDLSEKIFKFGTEDKLAENGLNSGFVKPEKVLYLNSIDVSLTLR